MDNFDTFDSDAGLDDGYWHEPGERQVHQGPCHTASRRAVRWDPATARDFDTPCPIGLPGGLPEERR